MKITKTRSSWTVDLARKKQNRPWANARRGFKQELIETLVDANFEYAEAKLIIEAIFDSITQALRRKETVVVDGFGAWAVLPPKQRRAIRLNKIVEYDDRIKFIADPNVFEISTSAGRNFHPGWEHSPTRKAQLRGNKLRDHLKRQEELRQRELLKKYVRAICHFFEHGLVGGDWSTVWTQRWTGPYYPGEFRRAQSSVDQPRSIDSAEIVMQETKPPAQSYRGLNRLARLNNESIDGVQWYARWTANLDVDRDLWEQAEHLANDHLLGRS